MIDPWLTPDGLAQTIIVAATFVSNAAAVPAPTATDLAEAITLVNALKTALDNLGITA